MNINYLPSLASAVGVFIAIAVLIRMVRRSNRRVDDSTFAVKEAKMTLREAQITVEATERIAIDRARYMRYLQKKLDNHGIQYKQELEYLDDSELHHFNNLMDGRAGL